MTDARTGRVSQVTILLGFAVSLFAALLFAWAVNLDRRKVAGAPEVARIPALPGKVREAPRSEAATPEKSKTSPPARGEEGSSDRGQNGLLPTLESLQKTVRGNSPLDRKAADLRTAYKARIDPELSTFSYVLSAESPDAALRLHAAGILAEGSRTDPKARKLLVAYLATQPSSEAGRAPAVIAVCTWGAGDELAPCVDALYRESDAEVVVAAARRLAVNPSDSARALLRDLASTHPDPEARRRAAEVAEGRDTPAPEAGEESE